MNQLAKATPSENKMLTLKTYITKNKASIGEVLPRHMTPDRITKIALVAASRNPILLQCTPESILRSLMDASSLGLEPNGGLGLAYLIPFKNNKNGGVWEAQFMPSYKGLIDLARRSGNIVSIEAHVVHEKDKFECSFGLEPRLVHVPAWDSEDPGKMRLVYAVAKLKDGGTQCEVMTLSEINKVKASSRASGYGPWVDWPEEMAKKTVVKRLCKMLPMSVELSTAVEADNAVETGEAFINIETTTPEQIAASSDDGFIEPPESKSDVLAAKLGA